MNAMLDARCPKCGKRFGWRGKVTDRPPCPKCKHAIPREKLERDQAEVDRVLTAHLRSSFCGVPGHTEADMCSAPYIVGTPAAASHWCGACARAKRQENTER